ncbi:hypothetical protein ACTFIU_007891 [Dictyostelium citrinum]
MLSLFKNYYSAFLIFMDIKVYHHPDDYNKTTWNSKLNKGNHSLDTDQILQYLVLKTSVLSSETIPNLIDYKINCLVFSSTLESLLNSYYIIKTNLLNLILKNIYQILDYYKNNYPLNYNKDLEYIDDYNIISNELIIFEIVVRSDFKSFERIITQISMQ